MRIIKVTSLPLDEVVQEIASELGTKAEENFGEHFLSLPNHIGSGIIKGINFDGGLGIIQYNCTFNEDTEIQFILNSVHPLKFIYVNSGLLHHRFANEENTHTVQQFQNAIVASCDKHGHIISFDKGVNTCIYSLEINRKVFQNKLSYNPDGMNAKIRSIFQDVEAKETFYYEGDYSLKMVDIFKRISDFKRCDFLYRIFMEGIAYQTLVDQVSQYLDDQQHSGNRTLLRRTEIELVVKTADFVVKNLSTYRTLPHLTSYSGLNARKLQDGFKHLFHKTINEFVFDARLDLAKNLLLTTDDNISEIVYKIGLSSKSYFSKIFQEKYGILPSKFRMHKYNAGTSKTST